MDLARFYVVLDACVLFPASVRDCLLRAAQAGLYQLYWSELILEEARRNLVRKGLMSEEKSHDLIRQMKDAFPQAMVDEFEHLIPSMQNDEGDRHVLAAAVHIGAQTIVTQNLKHFPPTSLGSNRTAQSPDEFLQMLFDLQPEEMIVVINKMSAIKKNPPKTVDQILDGLARAGVPVFAELVRVKIIQEQRELAEARRTQQLASVR